MPALKTTALSSRVYAIGIALIAVCSLVFHAWDPGQPAPASLPHRATLACAAAVLMLIASAALLWPRTAALGSTILTLYYAFIVVVFLNGRIVLLHPAQYAAWEELAIQLSVAAGALLLFAATAPVTRPFAASLTRLAQVAFGLCCLVWAGAHIAYLRYTASLVPTWLPPSRHFWTWFTAAGFALAGIAILARRMARMAAMLLTVMFAGFAVLVHLRLLLSNPSSHYNWTEAASNLAVTGAAWILADSLPR